MQLNSAFHHVTTAYMHRREEHYYSANFDSSCVQLHHYTYINWDNFIHGVVVLEEWWANFCMLVQISADRPERQSASACGRNDNTVGARGCFHKADLHAVVMLLKCRGKTLENHQCVWIISTNYFCHHRTNSWGCHRLPGARLTFHQNTAYRAWSDSLSSVDRVLSQRLRVTDCTHTSK